MKVFLAFALLTLSLSSAFACSPPPMIIAQKQALDQAINSKAFSEALSAEMAKDYTTSITSIKANGQVVVALSSGCSIQLSSHYKSPVAEGMCPRFVKVVSKTVCK